MSNSWFKFKQFTVRHDQCAMKVGTDGVLLGAWSDVSGALHILDIGTGTGLVALMIAQRSDARIVALDIDSNAVFQARENIAASPWKDRIKVLDQDFRYYRPAIQFDLIVCNPPYFVDSLESPLGQRTIARHNASLSYDELLEGVARCMTMEGRFCVIIPTGMAGEVKKLAANLGLYPSRQLILITSPGKPSKRVLVEFVFDAGIECVSNEMLIEEKRHQYSAGYIELTKAYYLDREI